MKKKINFINDIYEYFDTKDELRDRTSHYPSSAARCLREQWWQWNKAPYTNPPDPTSRLKMRMGDVWEDFILTPLASKYNIERQHAFKVNIPDLLYPISGKMDFVLTDLNRGLELKSTFGRAIDWTKKNGAKEDHKTQVACYLYCTDISPIDLLYFARDSGYMFHFTFYRENLEGVWVNAINRLKTLEKHLEEKTLPPQEGKNKSTYPCSYCAYQGKCWEDDASGKR